MYKLFILLLLCGTLRADIVDYEIIAELGRGTSTVFLARDPQGQEVALKRMPSREQFRNFVLEEHLDRMFLPDGTPHFALKEFAFAQLLEHESFIKIVKIFTAINTEGHVCSYLVMEYVPGTTLNHIACGQLTREQAVDCAHNFLAAMQCGLSHNLIHTDLHSENIMIDEGGNLKIIDIGSFDELLVGHIDKHLKALDFIEDLIDTILDILKCADFTQEELKMMESSLWIQAKTTFDNKAMRSHITDHSASTYISFIDALFSVIAHQS